MQKCTKDPLSGSRSFPGDDTVFSPLLSYCSDRYHRCPMVSGALFLVGAVQGVSACENFFRGPPAGAVASPRSDP